MMNRGGLLQSACFQHVFVRGGRGWRGVKIYTKSIPALVMPSSMARLLCGPGFHVLALNAGAPKPTYWLRTDSVTRMQDLHGMDIKLSLRAYIRKWRKLVVGGTHGVDEPSITGRRRWKTSRALTQEDKQRTDASMAMNVLKLDQGERPREAIKGG